MSIVITSPVASVASRQDLRSESIQYGLLLSAALTPLSVLILGYHPYAEDGGLYLAGIKYLLNTSLFPFQREFVTAPLHYSAFAPFMAFLVRHTGLQFETVIFVAFLLTLWATIFAGWSLARQSSLGPAEQKGATLLLALWLSLPVAGTSLMLIDPYLTARSFSTPLVLLAVSSALSALCAKRQGDSPRMLRATIACIAFLVVAAVFHPLMAGYGVTFVAAMMWLRFGPFRSSVVRLVFLLGAAVVLAALVQILAPPEPMVFARVALTRSYWYLSQWQWFEVIGLVAPAAILLRVFRSSLLPGLRPLLGTALAVAASAVVVSLLFARQTLSPSGVAHLQPLRLFQLVYFVLILTLGALLGRFVLRKRRWAWVAAAIVLGTPVTVPSLLTFSHSRHLELPLKALGQSPNRWVEAFSWVRQNTPQDALFALDANYISAADEDAQSFRAIAERSALPDYSKDGGETAVNPQLSKAWAVGVDAQQSLSSRDDPERDERLRSLGVTWLVLHSDAVTDAACAYNNGTVKVCRLPALSTGRAKL